MKYCEAKTDEEILKCFPVMKLLRPHLVESDFLEKVRRQMSEGYRIIYIETDGALCSLGGFRVGEFMDWGKVLYLDDLITDPSKKRNGYAGRIFDWLEEEASRLECDEIHLDTGHQRHDAHRLYLNKGFLFSSHHVSKVLSP